MVKDAILIITEKPAAAAKIAAALSGATDEKITDKNKVSYYETACCGLAHSSFSCYGDFLTHRPV